MILLIDNYDSFTWNVFHLIAGLGYDVEVRRNDAISVDSALNLQPEAIFISPGPCTPNEAGICLDLIREASQSQIPTFGICLGMQAIAQNFGGIVARAGKLMHGKVSAVRTKHHPLFDGIPTEFNAARYHSLVATHSALPACLDMIAESDGDDEIMAIAHQSLPIAGVQFHPESIASEYGEKIIQNFMTFAKEKR